MYETRYHSKKAQSHLLMFEFELTFLGGGFEIYARMRQGGSKVKQPIEQFSCNKTPRHGAGNEKRGELYQNAAVTQVLKSEPLSPVSTFRSRFHRARL